MASRLHREDGFAADAVELAARQASVAGLGDGGVVRVDELELERRRADVQDENVHETLNVRARICPATGQTPGVDRFRSTHTLQSMNGASLLLLSTALGLITGRELSCLEGPPA